MEKMIIVRLIHPHIPAIVNRTEMWLKQRAYAGWQLIEFHGWIFVFRKCSPSGREYLIYSGFGASKGVSFDYHMARMKYGKAKAQSKLNKLNTSVFEVDMIKLDSEYLRFVRLRNTYYLKHYIALSAFSMLALTCILTISLFVTLNVVIVFLTLLWLFITIYALLSSIVLNHDMKNLGVCKKL